MENRTTKEEKQEREGASTSCEWRMWTLQKDPRRGDGDVTGLRREDGTGYISYRTRWEMKTQGKAQVKAPTCKAFSSAVSMYALKKFALVVISKEK